MPERDRESDLPATAELSAEFSSLEVMQRLLIPASAGGLVIGRAGSHIRTMAEHSGAKVSLSQKVDAVTERVVTIVGQLGECSRCLELLLETLQKEPAVARFTNLTASYSAEEQQRHHSNYSRHHLQQQRQHHQQRQHQQQRHSYGSSGGGLSPVMPTALYTHSSNTGDSSSSYNQHYPQHYANGGAASGSSSTSSAKMVPSADAPVFYPETVLQQQQLLMQQQQQQQFVASATAAGQPYASAVAAAAAITTIVVAIPDVVVGAILGRGGNVINDLQVNLHCIIMKYIYIVCMYMYPINSFKQV
jgi:KH domain